MADRLRDGDDGFGIRLGMAKSGPMRPVARAAPAQRVDERNVLAPEDVVLAGAAVLAGQDDAAGDIAYVDQVEFAFDEDRDHAARRHAGFR